MSVAAEAEAPARERRFPCKACGADLVCPPGVGELACPYCGVREAIPRDARAIREYALSDLLPRKAVAKAPAAFLALACAACGARLDAAREAAARPCPYCGGTLVAGGDSAERIAPEAVLPFRIERAAAEQAARRWLRGLWFAPSDLKRAVTLERLVSLYAPYWTFDSHTLSSWEGEAGFHYWVETGSGQNRRRERRTRWEWRNGTHEEFFDDLLVPGGDHDDAGGYRLDGLQPYAAEYLAGHAADTYRRDPQAAWPLAKARIESAVRSACSRALGGDTQRGLSVATAHRGVACKLVLLPRWQAGYRYRGRPFRLVVNGQSGAVSGSRPYSALKITFAVIVTALVVAAVIVGIVLANG